MTGSNDGGSLRDEVAISLCFAAPVVFSDAVMHAHRVVDFFGLLLGRPQDTTGFYIATVESLTTGNLLQVEAMHGERSSKAPNERPSSYDVLLDGITDPEAFSSLTTNWLARSESWHDARWRFFNSFAEERFYDINRLTASANMFDVLPSTAVPADNVLTPELVAAHDICRATFRALPNSPERDSVLNSLGRLTKASLKLKIRHRARILLDQAGEVFPDLLRVTDEAVNCRNFFVHGSPGTLNYEQHFEMVTFFTDTLEFVFAVSDLIEAGWNFTRWLQRGSTLSHPFGRYKVSYSLLSRKLLSLL